MSLKTNRGGFIEIIFLMFFVALIFFMYVVTRGMDIAENDVRRKQGLPEKEMITDSLTPKSDDEKIEELEERIKELENELRANNQKRTE